MQAWCKLCRISAIRSLTPLELPSQLCSRKNRVEKDRNQLRSCLRMYCWHLPEYVDEAWAQRESWPSRFRSGVYLEEPLAG